MSCDGFWRSEIVNGLVRYLQPVSKLHLDLLPGGRTRPYYRLLQLKSLEVRRSMNFMMSGEVNRRTLHSKIRNMVGRECQVWITTLPKTVHPTIRRILSVDEEIPNQIRQRISQSWAERYKKNADNRLSSEKFPKDQSIFFSWEDGGQKKDREQMPILLLLGGDQMFL